MSGINEIKKKAKLSIDELYDSQPVGNLDNQEVIKQENKQSRQPSNQPSNNANSLQNNKPFSKQLIQTGNQNIDKQATHTSNLHLNHKQEFQSNRQASQFSMTKQHPQKIPTYKMTFNLTEDIFKAFNDLYANRMLQGRKTEKSEMICEAIEWLIQMENKQTELAEDEQTRLD